MASWRDAPFTDDVQRNAGERAMQASATLTPAEQTRSDSHERSPSNLAELKAEIKRTKDPKNKVTLQAELDKQSAAADDMGPRWMEAPLVEPEVAAFAPPVPPVQRSPWQSLVGGTSQGLSAGLGQYITAGAAMGLDRLRNPNAPEPLGWKQALGYTRDEHAALQQANPGTYLGGELAGGAGLGIATGGSSLARLAGTGAGIGAVSGFTRDESLKDAAIGAGIGGALGSVARVLPIAQEKFLRSAVVRDVSNVVAEQAQILKQTLNDLRGVMPQFKKLGDTELLKEAKKAMNPIKFLAAGETPKPNEQVLDALMAKSKLESAKRAATQARESTPAELIMYGKRRFQPEADNALNALRGAAGSTIPGAMLGGAYSIATGGDIGSGMLHGAIGQSAGVPLLRYLGKQVAPEIFGKASNVPSLAMDAAKKFGTAGAVRIPMSTAAGITAVGTEQLTGIMSYDDYIKAYNEAKTTKERLELGARYAAQLK